MSPHQAARFEASAAIRNPQEFRLALRLGRMPGTSVVIPTYSTTTFVVVAEPRILRVIQTAYGRYKAVVQPRFSNLPDITVSPSDHLAALCTDPGQLEALYRQTADEALRLTQLQPTVFSKTPFIQSLHRMMDGRVERIRTANPIHRLILEHERTARPTKPGPHNETYLSHHRTGPTRTRRTRASCII